jgi:antirestriction protein ArdC
VTTKEREQLIEKINRELHARLERMASGPDQWLEFIDQVATFGAQYSLGNQVLLWWQAQERGIEPRYFLPYGRKDGSTGWLAQGRQVRKGEKSYKIWAPIKRRPTEDEVARWAANGRTVKRDRDGRPSYMVFGWKLASTFELSQTDGEPFEVPSVQVRRRVKVANHSPQLLLGEGPTGAFDDTVKLIKDAGYSFDLVAPGTDYLSGPHRNANGITVKNPAAGVQVVQVRDDVSDAQRVKTTVHELAHIRCGHLDGRAYSEHRGRCETEAESVAHIVAKALGLNSASYTDAYVLSWANGDLDMVKQCADTVLRVAKGILSDLDPAHDDEHPE